MSVSAGATSECVLAWALIYVPVEVNGGTGSPPIINAVTLNNPIPFYEPSQHVMACGIWDTNGGPLRIAPRVSRTCRPGDSLWLSIRITDGGSPNTVTVGSTLAVRTRL